MPVTVPVEEDIMAAACAKPRVPALWLGAELEIAGDASVGAALLFSSQVCHLSAFSES